LNCGIKDYKKEIEMAYMTEASFMKLISELSIKVEITEELFKKEIYPSGQLYHILNDLERKELFNYAMLLKDEVQFETKYYKYVPEEPDTKKLVFSTGGKTKFHLNNDCEYISQDFLDFFIPEEIQKVGSEAVLEYRNWFKGKLFKEKYIKGEITTAFINREFNRKYCEKYGIKPLEENSGILVMDKKNSNIKTLAYSFDMISFKKELFQLLYDYADKFRVPEAQIVAKHSYLAKEPAAVILRKLKEILPKTPITDKNFSRIVDDLQFARKVIVPILNLLKGYLKWTYGLPNKDFDKITLEHFGLECCQSCAGKK
jgi:hypothetical protein